MYFYVTEIQFLQPSSKLIEKNISLESELKYEEQS